MNPYYADDSVTLYHGDCREVTGWLAADVLVTDPPYGIGWQSPGGWTNAIQNDGDTSSRDAALEMWGAKPAAVFGDFLKPKPAKSVQVLIYEKSDCSGVRGSHAGFRRNVEAIFLAGRWPVGVGGVSSVIRTNGRVAGPRGFAIRHGHPHAKPLDVLETLIAACPPGVIADPFAGSGSTLVAARNQGRQAIGVEVNERYCELAARRLSQQVMAVTP